MNKFKGIVLASVFAGAVLMGGVGGYAGVFFQIVHNFTSSPSFVIGSGTVSSSSSVSTSSGVNGPNVWSNSSSVVNP